MAEHLKARLMVGMTAPFRGTLRKYNSNDIQIQIYACLRNYNVIQII